MDGAKGKSVNCVDVHDNTDMTTEIYSLRYTRLVVEGEGRQGWIVST